MDYSFQYISAWHTVENVGGAWKHNWSSSRQLSVIGRHFSKKAKVLLTSDCASTCYSVFDRLACDKLGTFWFLFFFPNAGNMYLLYRRKKNPKQTNKSITKWTSPFPGCLLKRLNYSLCFFLPILTTYLQLSWY